MAAILVKPTKMSLEKWMYVSMGPSLDLFTFSGFAEFGPPTSSDPELNVSLIGKGSNDSTAQTKYVSYKVTDMLVGPHWQRVTQICPSVWAAGHDQRSPDEADGMGYQVTAIRKVNLVELEAGFSRIELQVALK